MPAQDGEELDACVPGVFEPVAASTGRCIAVIRPLDDEDGKLVVVADGVVYSEEQIRALTEFQEQLFSPVIVRPGGNES